MKCLQKGPAIDSSQQLKKNTDSIFCEKYGL